MVLLSFVGAPSYTGGTTGYLDQTNCPSSIDFENDPILSWPIKGNKLITQRFHRYYHPALDLRTGYDMPIYSSGYGFVETTGYDEYGYGYYAIVDHKKGFKTLYAHMGYDPEVEVDEFVYPGKLLGYSGNTGHSSGAHLHFEVIYLGCYVDPLDVLSVGG